MRTSIMYSILRPSISHAPGITRKVFGLALVVYRVCKQQNYMYVYAKGGCTELGRLIDMHPLPPPFPNQMKL